MLVVFLQVGEISVVNVDCSRAGPGQLTLEAIPESSPTGAATGSGSAAHIHPSWLLLRLEVLVIYFLCTFK